MIVTRPLDGIFSDPAAAVRDTLNVTADPSRRRRGAHAGELRLCRQPRGLYGTSHPLPLPADANYLNAGFFLLRPSQALFEYYVSLLTHPQALRPDLSRAEPHELRAPPGRTHAVAAPAGPVERQLADDARSGRRRGESARQVLDSAGQEPGRAVVGAPMGDAGLARRPRGQGRALAPWCRRPGEAHAAVEAVAGAEAPGAVDAA